MGLFNKTESRSGMSEPKKDDVFDVDAVTARSGISATMPKSAEGWNKKFEHEDEHIRKLSC